MAKGLFVIKSDSVMEGGRARSGGRVGGEGRGCSVPRAPAADLINSTWAMTFIDQALTHPPVLLVIWAGGRGVWDGERGSRREESRAPSSRRMCSGTANGGGRRAGSGASMVACAVNLKCVWAWMGEDEARSVWTRRSYQDSRFWRGF